MKVSINQPAYLPWLGYFDRIANSDLHIVLDNVQFEKNSVTNRNKVRTAAGWCWLTVPVKTKGKFGSLIIGDLEIDNSSNWTEKHWKTICQCYGKTPFFEQYSESLKSIYSSSWTHLIELTDCLNAFLLDEVLKISTPVRYASKLQSQGKKDDLILNICREVGATTYLSGPFGREYLDENKFHQAGIIIEYQDYVHPEYHQHFHPFEPFLSTLDLIMNCGDKSLEVIKNIESKLKN